jgi:hypothetical protein
MTERPEMALGGFPAIVNSRLAAEARIARAVSFLWSAAGGASALTLIGAGAMAAMYGFSFITSPISSADILANSFAKALEQSKIKATVNGAMAIPSDTQLSLADGQTVSLSEGTVVKVDPNSSIKVVGDFKIDVPQPSKQQLQLDTQSNSKEIPFTRYTVFKYAKFNSGAVVTAWNYELSDPSSPIFQRCYYEELLGNNVAATQTIAVNGLPRRPSALNKLSFDFDGALVNCIWFSE